MGECPITLKQLQPGETAIVERMDIEGVMRRRLLDLGFIKGAKVTCVRKSPLGDPVAFQVSSTVIALRESESKHIIVRIAEEG
ncbi:MAG TPA: ferrous iron transport protein A [Bacillaceae bacterium]